MFRVISCSIASTGLCSSGITAPTPALLTSMLMRASSRRRCSTCATPSAVPRSATISSTWRALAVRICAAIASSLPALRATSTRS
jgi:hypothetical protein